MDLTGIKDFFGNVRAAATEIQHTTVAVAKNFADTKATLNYINAQPIDAAQIRHTIAVAQAQGDASGSVGMIGTTAADAVNRLLTGEGGGLLVIGALVLVAYLALR